MYLYNRTSDKNVPDDVNISQIDRQIRLFNISTLNKNSKNIKC